MQWIRLIGCCLLAAALVTILRQMNMPAAALLTTAFGVLVLGAVLPDMGRYFQTIRTFLSSLALEGEYYRVMLKALGIMVTTQAAVQVCQDLEAPGVARKAELLGRVAMLGVALPVFVSLAQMAVDMLG